MLRNKNLYNEMNRKAIKVTGVFLALIALEVLGIFTLTFSQQSDQTTGFGQAFMLNGLLSMTLIPLLIIYALVLIFIKVKYHSKFK